MTHRELIITDKALSSLHREQVNALELAALDTFYRVERKEPSPELAAALEHQSASMLLCTPEDAASMLARFPSAATRLIVLNFGDGRSEALRTLLDHSGILFIVGAVAPNLLRAMIGSILEFRIGRGHRGLLPRLIRTPHVQLQTFRLDSSDQRSKAQAFTSSCVRTAYQNSAPEPHSNPGLEDAAWPWPGSQYVNKAASDIVDELLMNAIWDAHPDLRHIPRSGVCTLKPDEPVLVECAFDNLNFALAVQDCHGTFPWKALPGPMAFALGLKPDLKVNEGPGGAGLGLYMILQRTSMLTIDVSRGHLSRVTALLRIDDSTRDMQARPKSVLVYSHDMDGLPKSAQPSTMTAAV